MSTVATKIQCSPERLLTVPDADAYELLGGELVERKMGAKSSFIAGQIHHGSEDFHCLVRDLFILPQPTAASILG